LLRWTVLALCLLCGACSTAEITYKDLPPGDATRGMSLFNQSINGAPTCASCHAITDARLAGPGLAGYAVHAAGRVASLSAEAYTVQSLVRPAAYVVEGYTNLMYAQYGERLSKQQIADLVAYLLSL
jgi:cytochrome c553